VRTLRIIFFGFSALMGLFYCGTSIQGISDDLGGPLQADALKRIEGALVEVTPCRRARHSYWLRIADSSNAVREVWISCHGGLEYHEHLMELVGSSAAIAYDGRAGLLRDRRPLVYELSAGGRTFESYSETVARLDSGTQARVVIGGFVLALSLFLLLFSTNTIWQTVKSMRGDA
jgi:hypothetical protein